MHSPFVFDLVTKCFYDKTKFPEYFHLKNNSKKNKLFFRVLRYFQPKTILKIGNSNEIETNMFSSEITSIEEFQKNKISKNDNAYDLVYFNKNQSQKSTLEYFEILLPTVTNDSVWIINDIHESIENENTWEIIKNDPKIKVTIDTFDFGMVFFRAEQEKEHFVIRV